MLPQELVATQRYAALCTSGLYSSAEKGISSSVPLPSSLRRPGTSCASDPSASSHVIACTMTNQSKLLNKNFQFFEKLSGTYFTDKVFKKKVSETDDTKFQLTFRKVKRFDVQYKQMNQNCVTKVRTLELEFNNSCSSCSFYQCPQINCASLNKILANIVYTSAALRPKYLTSQFST